MFPFRNVNEQVRKKLGSYNQLFDVKTCFITDGTSSGSRMLLVHNPNGVSFELMLDRGMDIGWADAGNTPLAWQSAAGIAPGNRHEPMGNGWVHTFGGGLLTTCGLASTGTPSEDDGSHYGLHGRIGHLPVRSLHWRTEEIDADPVLRIFGVIVESALGSSELTLEREIRASLASPRLEIIDVVRNTGFSTAGHMFRHHYNFGYPIADDETEILGELEFRGFRDSKHNSSFAGELPLRLALSEKPVNEEVLYFKARAGDEIGRLSVVPREAGQAVDLEWDVSTFNHFIIWRDSSPGVNVLGLEPSTSWDDGRRRARENGQLVELHPGESKHYWSRLVFSKCEGAEC